ncbi:MAG: ATP synthase subunit I [Pseudomonadota bacterium]
MDWPETYRNLKTRSWIILLILTAVSIFFMRLGLTLGVILGGLVTIVNFDILQRNIRRAFSTSDEVKFKKIWVIGKFYFRFLALGVVIYLLIRVGWVNPIGLVVGLSTVVFSIISFGIHNAFKSASVEAI